MRGDTEITNREDVIDSRDIIDRIEYLEDERTTLSDKVDEAQEGMDDEGPTTNALKDAQTALADWDESDEGQELKALEALQDEAEGYSSGWRHGATLIRDSYFTEYAEDLASEVTEYNPNKVSWPFTCIDWEKAADELKQDYTSVDFDGVDYWIR